MVQFINKPTETVLDGLYMLRSLFQFHEMFVSLSIEGRRQRCGPLPSRIKKMSRIQKFWQNSKQFFLGGSVYTAKV